MGPEHPGVRNGIDTTGHRSGTVLGRFVSGGACAETPEVRVVRSTELREWSR